MNTTLTADEVRFQLEFLGEHLAPVDLRLLLQVTSELSPTNHSLGVDQALVKLYPKHEHKAATDALGKLRARLALAAKAKGVTFELTVSGAKKGGAASRVLSFKGESRMAQTSFPALALTEGRLVNAMAIPGDGAVVLLVTVNANESAAVLAAFVAPGVLPKPVDRQGRSYQDLGRHGDFRVVHTICEMGSVGPGAALVRVSRAIDDWSPEVVIGVGIAFGADPAEQKFGDVLIAKQIESYEPQRVGAKGKLVLRGDRVTASTNWLSRLRQVNEGHRHAGSGNTHRLTAWPRVQFGLMLSGEKLVDNLDYREALQQAAQGQAKGGEMEGAGIYAAAADTKTDWMIVKGISDWADGSKAGATPEQKAEAEAMQRLAAANAVRVVWAALTLEPLPGQTEQPDAPSPSEHRHDPEYACYEAAKRNFVGPRAVATHLEKNALDSATSRADPDAAVDAQEHIEQWLHRPDAAPVFAVLGEYGMGKTVICQRLAQTMNEHRRALGKGSGKGGAQRAFYFDLRDLTNLHGSVPTLEKLLAECIARRWKPAPGEAPLTPEHVVQAHAQGALVIFDGLDEVLVHYDGAPGQTFTRELLSLVKPGTLGRLLLSCRTQFFRTLREQTNHLTGEDRSDKTARAYEAMTLLPFTEAQIKTYLNLAVPGADADALIEAIAAVHNLTEMAQRPYTLSLIVDFLPDLERLRAAGKPVYGVTLYRNMVRSWLERDAGKHHIKPDHKMKLAAHLAADLWRQGQRLIEAEHLETWFGRWLRADEDLSDRYKDLSRDKLEEDLRNSTFLSRQDGASEEQSGFRFAHTSMQEFFVAQYLFDALRSNEPQRWQMRQPSNETLDFLGQMLSEARDVGLTSRSKTDALATLSGWRKSYSAQTSELLLAYALRAGEKAWPVPVLVGLDMRGAKLMGWQFKPAVGQAWLDLSDARFDGATLREACFDRVRLPRARFEAGSLDGAQFLNCDLDGAVFDNARASGAVVRACTLNDTSFAGVDAHRMQFLLCPQLPALPRNSVIAPTASADHRTLNLALLQGHQNGVSSCALSGDAAQVVSAGDDGTVRIWDARTGELLRTLQGHEDWVRSCAFSGNGGKLVSASDDSTVRLWDARTGELLRTLQGHEGTVRSCAFSGDGGQVVSAGSDGTVRLWDARTGELLRTLQGHGDEVNSCVFSCDGGQVVSAGDDGTVRLWDARTGELLRTLQGHQGWVLSCAFSGDGGRVVSAGDDGTVRLWDARKGELLRTLRGHAHWMSSCAFSGDGGQVVSAGSDGMVRLWDARTGEPLRTLQGHEDGVRSCAFSGDGEQVVSAGSDGTVRLWDARTGELLRTLQGREDWMFSCALSGDGGPMVSAGSDGTVRLWDARTGELLRALQGHEGGVRSCAISGDGAQVVSAGYDGTLRLWDARTGELLWALRGHEGGVRSCALSADGGKVVSAAFDGTLCLWNARTGKLLHTLQGHEGEVNSCAFSRDGGQVVSASDDGTVSLWDGRTGDLLRTLQGDENWASSCAFSGDGGQVLSAGGDGTVRLWDERTGELLRELQGHESEVNSCAFSGDGGQVVSAGDDGMVRLWDARTGELLRTLQGHQGEVNSCAFSGDVGQVVSAGDDGTVRLWDASTGELLRVTAITPQGHCVWTPSDNRIIEASGDAWRWMGWLDHDENGMPTRLPLEHFGLVPEPKRLMAPGVLASSP